MKIHCRKSRLIMTLLILSLSLFTRLPSCAEETQDQNPKTGQTSEAADTVVKASVKIKQRRISLKKGRSKILRVTKRNAGSKRIVWKSSNKKVARVSQTGMVTGKDGGDAVVTARVQGTDVESACKVEVVNYRIMRMRTTGYCNCRRCAGRWAGHPTASGRMPRANHTIAVDPHLIKLGTKVQIGNVIYTAEDTGGAIKGHRIDVYYRSHRRASRHGVKYQLVKVFY
ncbi:MAG: Ig-like domain-containing protein [Eubacterium sp.]|nr:Ig-like domain-containing protein [Eubacterium sp.]